MEVKRTIKTEVGYECVNCPVRIEVRILISSEIIEILKRKCIKIP